MVDAWRNATQQDLLITTAPQVTGDLEPNTPANDTDANPAPGHAQLTAIVADHLEPDREVIGGGPVTVRRCAGHMINLYVRAMANARATQLGGEDDLVSVSSHSSMPSLQTISDSSEECDVE